MRLTRSFYARPTRQLAQTLLGCRLVRRWHGQRLSGLIVEAEAYIGESDQACHARVGRTARNAVMYGQPGFAYVYFTYGMHHCFNVVSGPAGAASAVLVRALEPVLGLAAMRRRRASGRARAATPDARLARGPGSLARALGLDRRHDGTDLTRGALWIADLAPRRGGRRIARGPRVGLTRAAARRWRYWLIGSAAVSAGPKRR